MSKYEKRKIQPTHNQHWHPFSKPDHLRSLSLRKVEMTLTAVRKYVEAQLPNQYRNFIIQEHSEGSNPHFILIDPISGKTIHSLVFQSVEFIEDRKYGRLAYPWETPRYLRKVFLKFKPEDDRYINISQPELLAMMHSQAPLEIKRLIDPELHCITPNDEVMRSHVGILDDDEAFKCYLLDLTKSLAGDDTEPNSLTSTCRLLEDSSPVNPDLVGIDPYSSDLTQEQQMAIFKECQTNPAYFAELLRKSDNAKIDFTQKCMYGYLAHPTPPRGMRDSLRLDNGITEFFRQNCDMDLEAVLESTKDKPDSELSNVQRVVKCIVESKTRHIQVMGRAKRDGVTRGAVKAEGEVTIPETHIENVHENVQTQESKEEPNLGRGLTNSKIYLPD